MADWGIKVSIPGKDVSSNTPGDFSLHSETFENVLRLTDAYSGNLTVTAAVGAPDVITVNHGLGYVPFFQVYAYFDENGTVSNTYNTTFDIVTPVYLMYVYNDIDANNLHINCFRVMPTPNTKIYWNAFFGKDQLV